MNDKQRLAIEAEELRNVRVLCVGDVMLDRYVYGDVERMSPEAPIPVLRVREERSMLGGAGNVARNLAALGAYVSFVAVIGPDEAGAEIASMLGALPQMEARLVTEESRRSTVKQRYVAMNQHVMRADRETTTALSHARQQELIGNIRALLPGVQVLVLSDYGKGALTADVCLSAIEEAHRLNIPVVVDPKGRNYANYRGADVITPNRKELSEISGLVLDSDAKIISAARQLIQQYSFGAVLVTRSHEGMSVVEGNGSVTHLAAEAREVFDVSGAGDTVVSTLSTGLALGLSLVDAATLANAAAGLVVGKVGTAVVYRDELAAKMRKRTLTSIDEKVATWSGAQERVAGWRRRGLRVGFTNGCFDLLHPGHLALMERAHGLCDRLIVGLNSDASVTRLKGPARPIQPEITRSTVLASMSNVDLVVVFEEDTPRQLIEFLCPDVLIKGGDYTVDTIVGADFVLSHGGRVEIIDLVPGFSTTKIVEKMIG